MLTKTQKKLIQPRKSRDIVITFWFPSGTKQTLHYKLSALSLLYQKKKHPENAVLQPDVKDLSFLKLPPGMTQTRTLPTYWLILPSAFPTRLAITQLSSVSGQVPSTDCLKQYNYRETRSLYI